MKHLKRYESFNEAIKTKDDKPIRDIISNTRIPKDLKEESLKYIINSTYVNKGRIFGLGLHPDLLQRIKSNVLPSGFNMGIDKNGYFIHTHRARSKSKITVDYITEKDIKFIDSTG